MQVVYKSRKHRFLREESEGEQSWHSCVRYLIWIRKQNAEKDLVHLGYSIITAQDRGSRTRGRHV
jgi:hypothetical protein